MTPRNEATPAANGGRVVNWDTGSYHTPRLSAKATLAARLSPRRKLYAASLLDFLNWQSHCGRWRDGAVRFDDQTYDILADPSAMFACDLKSMDRFAANQAIDDLYALGLVDVRLSGSTQIVLPLSANIEEAA
jgi:hypothetical protein